MAKLTAVEWLEEKLNIWQTISDEDTNSTLNTVRKLLEQVKQMEKEQSIAELRHKDGTPMRKYNSLKLKAIEMQNKQTAVEWLENELKKIPFINPKEAFEQAKQMEKEQMIKFADNYVESDIFYCSGEFDIVKGAEQYYNETYRN